jgi:hypothetical protein
VQILSDDCVCGRGRLSTVIIESESRLLDIGCSLLGPHLSLSSIYVQRLVRLRLLIIVHFWIGR